MDLNCAKPQSRIEPQRISIFPATKAGNFYGSIDQRLGEDHSHELPGYSLLAKSWLDEKLPEFRSGFSRKQVNAPDVFFSGKACDPCVLESVHRHIEAGNFQPFHAASFLTVTSASSFCRTSRVRRQSPRASCGLSPRSSIPSAFRTLSSPADLRPSLPTGRTMTPI